jgi:hypothetical protein
MKAYILFISAILLTSLSAGVASAQDSDSSRKYHPFLTGNFQIGLGVYGPSKTTKLGADAGSGGESLVGENDQSTGMLNFRWRFTKNWHFQTTYWNTESTSRQTLAKDWESPFPPKDPPTFKAGSFIGMGVDTTIARLFWGRSFSRKLNHDWGVGVGLHWLEIDAFVEGHVDVTGGSSGGGTEFRHESTSASVPLPNLGIWYLYSWSPNWVLTSRLDWLEITIDEYSGSMYDVSVGINYHMSDHFGLGFALNGFLLDVELDSPEWKGKLENEQFGPRLAVTWNW